MEHQEEFHKVGTGQEAIYTEDELTWGSLCHFSALLGMIWWVPLFGDWIPVGHLLAPLFVWGTKRKKSPYIDANGKEALHFQLIVTVFGFLLSLIPVDFISTYAVTILAACDVYLSARGGIRASNGKPRQYPFIPYRMLK